jgi:hypothetical protein
VKRLQGVVVVVVIVTLPASRAVTIQTPTRSLCGVDLGTQTKANAIRDDASRGRVHGLLVFYVD